MEECLTSPPRQPIAAVHQVVPASRRPLLIIRRSASESQSPHTVYGERQAEAGARQRSRTRLLTQTDRRQPRLGSIRRGVGRNAYRVNQHRPVNLSREAACEA